MREKRNEKRRLLSNIRAQQVVLDAGFDLLRRRLQVLSDLEAEPDFEHGGVALADALEEGGGAALGAELAEDREGAVCGGGFSVVCVSNFKKKTMGEGEGRNDDESGEERNAREKLTS